MKSGIINSSQLTKYGRWDAGFNLVVKEHEQRINALEKLYKPEEIIARILRLNTEDLKCLQVIATGSKAATRETIIRAANEAPYVAMALIEANLEAIEAAAEAKVKSAADYAKTVKNLMTGDETYKIFALKDSFNAIADKSAIIGRENEHGVLTVYYEGNIYNSYGRTMADNFEIALGRIMENYPTVARVTVSPAHRDHFVQIGTIKRDGTIALLEDEATSKASDTWYGAGAVKVAANEIKEKNKIRESMRGLRP